MSTKLGVYALIAVLLLCFTQVVYANGFAQNVSDATKPAIAVGIAAVLFTSGTDGKPNAARMTDAVIISYAAAELMKPQLKVNDDDGFEHSFPSGHTAVAFAAASSLAEIHPRQKLLYYAGAALVGWSRVETEHHTWADVAGGAVLGMVAGKWSFQSENGLMLGKVYKF